MTDLGVLYRKNKTLKFSKKKNYIEESVRQLSDHPKPLLTRNDPLQLKSFLIKEEGHLAVNHALITESWFIHQISVPVSLELKDTEVQAYRTDPVQVRSYPELFRRGL